MLHNGSTPPADAGIFKLNYDKGVAALRGGKFQQAGIYLADATDIMVSLVHSADSKEVRAEREKIVEKLLYTLRICENPPAINERGSVSPNGQISTHSSGKTSQEAGPNTNHLLFTNPRFSFADIVGHEAVKTLMSNAMIKPFTHSETYKKYELEAGDAALLFGPPGTGKTALAEAAAKEIDAKFFSVTAADIMNKWVGESEQNIKKVFAAARQCKRAIIFLDDCEELMKKDNDSGNGVGNRVVGEILTNLSGIASRSNKEGSAVLFLAATNEPWKIGTPMLRRFNGNVMYVGLPELEDRRAILEKKLGGIPIAKDVDLRAIAQMTEGYSGAELQEVVKGSKQTLVNKVIETSESLPLTQAILEAAVPGVRPVATVSMLAELQQWHDRYGKK